MNKPESVRALREAAERLRELSENASDVIYTLDLSGRFTSVNAAAERVTGYTQDELLRLSLRQILTPQSYARTLEVRDQRLAGGGPAIYELDLMAKDGHLVPVEVNAWLIRREGQVVGVQGIARDLTDRRRAEDAVREAMRRYLTLFDNVPIGLFRSTPDGRILDANPAMVRLLGYADTRTLLQTHADALYVDADARQRVRALLDRDGLVQQFETQFRRADGGACWVQLGARAVHDREGRIMHYEGVVEDVTQQKRAQQALVESEERSRALIEASPDGIVLTDLALNIIFCNRQIANLYGTGNTGDIVGRNTVEFVPPEEHEQARENMWRTRKEGVVRNIETRLRRADGSYVPVELSTAVVADSQGQPKAFMGIIRDITERTRIEDEIARRREELAGVLTMLSEVTARHDLPLLLHTIVERATSLLQGIGGGLYLADPERREVVCVISYNTKEDYTGVVLKYGEGAAGVVALTGKPLIVDDYRAWTGRAGVFDWVEPFTAVISVPLLWEGRVIGVLHVLQDRQRRTSRQRDLDVLTLFAVQAAFAVEYARLAAQARTGEDVVRALFVRPRRPQQQ